MTLDEAIKHCEEITEAHDKLRKRYDDASGYSRSHNEAIRTSDAKEHEKCSQDFRQLTEWLKELKAYKEQEPCEDAREAIKTLKENLCSVCAYGAQNMESCDIRSCDNRDAIKALEQEPCEDAISREDALMCMTGKYTADLEYKPDDIISQHIKRIKALPSVTPKQKTGEILTDYAIVIDINGFERRVKKTTYCSLCKCDLGYNGDLLTHYCPNCGVKLEYKGR